MFFILMDVGSGEWFNDILLWLLEQANKGMTLVLSLLPDSPFLDFQYNIPENLNSIMHLFFWVFPAHEIIVHYAAILSILLIYYVLRIVMNWLKMIGS